jgi:hypothetical protein
MSHFPLEVMNEEDLREGRSAQEDRCVCVFARGETRREGPSHDCNDRLASLLASPPAFGTRTASEALRLASALALRLGRGCTRAISVNWTSHSERKETTASHSQGQALDSALQHSPGPWHDVVPLLGPLPIIILARLFFAIANSSTRG